MSICPFGVRINEQYIKKNSMNRSIGLLLIILLVSSLGQVTSDLYLPSLPSMAKSLTVNTNWIQFTVAVYMAGFCVSQLVYGPWSDAIGRRRPLLMGLSISFIGSLVCWVSPNIYLLFLGRFLQGIGVGAGTALARPILRDLFEKETLAVYNSYLAIASVVILTIAPVIGGYIQQYLGWRYNFLFLTIYSFLILYFSYYKTPETCTHHHKDNFKLKVILTNSKVLLKSPIFIKFSIYPLLTYAGILAWLTEAPIVLQETVGLDPVQFGWLYVFSGIGFALGGFLNMKFVVRFGIEQMINIGFFCQLSAGLLMLMFFLLNYINAYVIVMPILFFMVGSSLVFPNSSAGALNAFPKIAGTAGAIFGFTQVLGGVISSSAVALAHDSSQLPIAIAFIIASLLSILVSYIFQSKL